VKANAERAETLREELRLLDDCRRRAKKFAPLVGSDTAIWLERLEAYMRAELNSLDTPANEKRARDVAWAILYTMHEKANPASASPTVFAKTAGLTVKTLGRCRRSAPAIVKNVYAMQGAELRHHWEIFANQLGLMGKRRADVQRITLPQAKRSPRRVP
jgi:hypothetical protein